MNRYTITGYVAAVALYWIGAFVVRSGDDAAGWIIVLLAATLHAAAFRHAREK